MDWLDLLVVQGTLKSLLQHHSSKASILQHSAFFTVQLSHPYMTTGRTIALTRWTFVGKIISLLFNLPFWFVIVFLPRSKWFLISWLQSPSTIILEPKKLRSVAISNFSPSIYHEVMGPGAMVLVFWMLSFKPAFSLSSFTLIKRLCSSSSLSTITVVSSTYLRLLIFLWQLWFQLGIYTAQHFTWCSLHRSYISRVTIYSLVILLSQFWTSPLFHVRFCCFLTCTQVSQEAGEVVWYSHLFKNFPQFVVIHTVKGFSVVNEAEVAIFLEFSCFLFWPSGCWQFNLWFLFLF